MDEVLGWWFTASDVLPHGDGRKVVLGEPLTVEPPIIPCKHGLHASVDPFDALQYARGSILYRVRLSDVIVEHKGDKHAASERTALARRDATEMLRFFARRQALSVIHLWRAPAVVREYLETGDESKRAAARDAARDADSSSASRDAYDARGAAWAAAWDSVWVAARDAARDAARAAAGTAAREMFNEMVRELFEGEL